MLTTRISRRDWLKASAASVLGTMVPLAATGKVFAHDKMEKTALDFSLEDVRIDQKLNYHPRTGRLTTQNERRAMVETRIHDGLWKAIRNAQRMVAESRADLRPALQDVIDRALRWAHVSLGEYDGKTLDVLNQNKHRVYHASGYSWKYPEKGLNRIANAVELNPEWAVKNFEPGPGSERRDGGCRA